MCTTQRVDAPDKAWQYLLVAAEPYETISFKACCGMPVDCVVNNVRRCRARRLTSTRTGCGPCGTRIRSSTSFRSHTSKSEFVIKPHNQTIVLSRDNQFTCSLSLNRACFRWKGRLCRATSHVRRHPQATLSTHICACSVLCRGDHSAQLMAVQHTITTNEYSNLLQWGRVRTLVDAEPLNNGLQQAGSAAVPNARVTCPGRTRGGLLVIAACGRGHGGCPLAMECRAIIIAILVVVVVARLRERGERDVFCFIIVIVTVSTRFGWPLTVNKAVSSSFNVCICRTMKALMDGGVGLGSAGEQQRTSPV